jgi:uncharacterized protein (TIGR04255 family)
MPNFRLRNSPVAEVIIGAQFDGTPFDSEFVFNFYDEIKHEYPHILEQPPVPSVFQQGDVNVQTMLEGFNVRRFLFSLDQSKLIQIQPNRLLFNWRKINNIEYPHFNSVVEKFLNVSDKIKEKRNLNQLINQLEVTYVDHIFVEDFNVHDYNPISVFNFINYKSPIKHLEHTMMFPVDDLNGSITINLRSGLNIENNKKLWVLESTCRGFKRGIPMNEWLDIAHSKLLDVFFEITTDEAKLKWEIEI